MPRCQVCNNPVGFFTRTCDSCLDKFPKFEVLGKAIEECYEIAHAIRTGTGEFENVDLERRLLMTTGAEHCINKLIAMFEELKGTVKPVERRSSFSSLSPAAGGRKGDV